MIGKSLFTDAESARRRRLILPRYVSEEATNSRYWEFRDNAQEIMTRWADLESTGVLKKRKETSLNAEFLHDVFGTALGYRTATDSPDEYELEREFAVPGVGSADGALGLFPEAKQPIAVIELKDANADLDRDRFNGRTPVQQCWDYLNGYPECPWGIVSNFISIRLYHRDGTPNAYEEFFLQDLREPKNLNSFLCLLERGSLVRPRPGHKLTTRRLLDETENRQKEVSDELYDAYSQNRFRLVEHLRYELNHTVESSIQIAQKILDRIIFVAFCEDRKLLPKSTIKQAIDQVPPFSKVTNPRWQNFLQLFHAVDKGHGDLPGYNGGLFRHDPEVDELQLGDEWTDFFHTISKYDFRDEINVDVLGHLFEKSIAELEKMREGGLFVGDTFTGDQPRMQKSAERKRFGIYYTPPDFTRFIVENTVECVIADRLEVVRRRHLVEVDELNTNKRNKKLAEYLEGCLDALRTVKICDPACGSGAFLIQAYDTLENHYVDIIEHLVLHAGENKALPLLEQIPDYILNDNLFGVDVSPQSVEIAQLALWIRSAKQGRTLSDLSENIVWSNSLVADVSVHPRAMKWEEAFPEVFERENPGFDCVIGNPPWERLKLQEREFFSLSAPHIAGATNAAKRRTLIEELKSTDPMLFEDFKKAKEQTESVLEHVRASGNFPKTAKGDINTYVLFAELATKIVAEEGLIGLLIPSGISSDKTTRGFFNWLVENKRLRALYDFENRKKIFPDVDSRTKFSIFLCSGGNQNGTPPDFVFFAHEISDLKDPNRHISLAGEDIDVLNPNTKTCPIFRWKRDAEITMSIYQRVPILHDRNRRTGGNPWGIRFLRMFDQTNDAEQFRDGAELANDGFQLLGNVWTKRDTVLTPLYEAKMVQMYDHRAASVVIDPSNWVRQGQPEPTSLVAHQNPEFVTQPRWWIDYGLVQEALGNYKSEALLCFKDITSATNQRTMIASWIPRTAVVNSAPLMLSESIESRLLCCLLANLNSFPYDFVARQKVGGVHLNYFIVEQLPAFAPDKYSDPCPWEPETPLVDWISGRVLKLTCVSEDMKSFAEECEFTQSVNRWNPIERSEVMAELDAAYFLLYGIDRADVEYILSTFQGAEKVLDTESGILRTDELVMQKYDLLRGCMKK